MSAVGYTGLKRSFLRMAGTHKQTLGALLCLATVARHGYVGEQVTGGHMA